MFPIIDFRNGRYQGQTKNKVPHGVGILLDKNFMFLLAEWTAGEVKGPAVIVFPSGRTFCGHLDLRKPQQLCTYQLTEDHVKLITFAPSSLHPNHPQKIAGILPLLQVILEIDNSDPRQAKVIKQHLYSTTDANHNIQCINDILNLDGSSSELLKDHRHCLQFMQTYFIDPHENLIEFMISEHRGKKEYFIGLRGDSLGIKIAPLEEPGLNYKQTGRVYLIRGVGMFTHENQMKDLGLKTLDNAMKGIIMQEGIFSIPTTIIKYEQGRRPVNSLNIFYNHLKRSLFYRDKIIPTDYLYELEKFVFAFNDNLRKIQTQKLAQVILENPSKSGNSIIEIERKRSEKVRENDEFARQRSEVQVGGHPALRGGGGGGGGVQSKLSSENYNVQRAKDQLYRSVEKLKKGGDSIKKVDYTHVEYVDPKYVKVTKLERQPRNYEAYRETHEKILEKTFQKSYEKTNQKPYEDYRNQAKDRAFGSNLIDKSYSKERDDYSRTYERGHDRIYSPSKRQLGTRNISPARRDDYERSYQRGYDRRYYPENRYEDDRRGKYTPPKKQEYSGRASPGKTTRYEENNYTSRQDERSFRRQEREERQQREERQYRPRQAAYSSRQRHRQQDYSPRQQNRRPRPRQPSPPPPRQVSALPNNTSFRRRLFKDNYFE